MAQSDPECKHSNHLLLKFHTLCGLARTERPLRLYIQGNTGWIPTCAKDSAASAARAAVATFCNYEKWITGHDDVGRGALELHCTGTSHSPPCRKRCSRLPEDSAKFAGQGHPCRRTRAPVPPRNPICELSSAYLSLLSFGFVFAARALRRHLGLRPIYYEHANFYPRRNVCVSRCSHSGYGAGTRSADESEVRQPDRNG